MVIATTKVKVFYFLLEVKFLSPKVNELMERDTTFCLLEFFSGQKGIL